MDLTCPHCHSEQTQKVSAIVSAGTTHSSGSTTVVGLANTGNGLAAGSAVGTVNMTNTSDLAQRLAPPEIKVENSIAGSLKMLAALSLLGLVPTLLAKMFHAGATTHTIILFATVALIVYTMKDSWSQGIENKKYNRDLYPAKFALWQHTYYCHRCGQTFVPKSD